jgi:RNA polymerase sigma factor for flagellar operon FliA
MSEQYPQPTEQEPNAPIIDSSTLERWRTHPLLTREQEQIIFGALRAHEEASEEYTIQDLRAETELGASIAQAPPAERVLWHHVLDSSSSVHELLIRCYDSFVWGMAHRFRGLPYELEDRVAAARVGLIDAINTFDATRDVRFVTHAHYAVLSSMQKEMCYRYKISLTDWRRLTVIRKVSAVFYGIYAKNPSREELARQLMANADGQEGRPYVPASNLEEYIDLYQSLAWRQDTTHEVPSGVSHEDEDTGSTTDKTLDFPAVESAEDTVIRQETNDTVYVSVNRLPEQNRNFMYLIAGLYGEKLSPVEAARAVGVPPEQADDFHKATLAMLLADRAIQEVASERHIAPQKEDLLPHDITSEAGPQASHQAKERRRLMSLSAKELEAVLAGYKNPRLREAVYGAWQGLSVAQIAKKRGVGRWCVHLLLQEFEAEQGIDSIPNSKRRRQEQAIEMYLDGVGIKEISQRVGVGPSVVVNYLDSSGVRPSKNIRVKDPAYIAALTYPSVQAVRAVLSEQRPEPKKDQKRKKPRN